MMCVILLPLVTKTNYLILFDKHVTRLYLEVGDDTGQN